MGRPAFGFAEPHPLNQVLPAGTAKPNPVAVNVGMNNPSVGAGGRTFGQVTTVAMRTPIPTGSGGGAGSTLTVGNTTTAVTPSAANQITINVPSGTVSGDLLVAYISSSDNGNTTNAAATGWTLQDHWDSFLDSWQDIAVLTKVAGSSEPASYTFTGLSDPSTGNVYSGSMTRIHDSAGTPVYVDTFHGDDTVGPVLTASAITGGYSGTVTICGFTTDQSGTTGSYVWTAPFTEVADVFQSSNGVTLAVGYATGVGPNTPEVTYSGDGTPARGAGWIAMRINPSNPSGAGSTPGVGAANNHGHQVFVLQPTASGNAGGGGGTPPPTGGFQVEARRLAGDGAYRVDIINPSGQRVWLRGANCGGWGSFEAFGSPNGQSSVIQQWGWNCIRCTIYSAGPAWGWGDPRTANGGIDAFIDECTAKGIVCIVGDWTFTQQGYDATAMQNSLLPFYRSLATKYKNNPYVWWEPFNESYLAANWVSAHREVLAAIRGVGNTSMFVVCSEGAAGDTPTQVGGDLLKTGVPAVRSGFDRNVIGDFHDYGWENDTVPAVQAHLDDIHANDVATIIGEFGVPYNGVGSTAGPYQSNVNGAYAAMGGAPGKGTGLTFWHGNHNDAFSVKADGGPFWSGGAQANLSQFGTDFWNVCHSVPSGYV